MALNKGFGRQLRDARVSSGLTYGTISRKLRIRSDILQAIEEEDFTTMPPHSYARGMVHAYASLLGLDPDKITDDYMEAVAAVEGRNSSRRRSRSTTLPSSLGGDFSSDDIERIYREDSQDAARERLRRRRERRSGEQASRQDASHGNRVPYGDTHRSRQSNNRPSRRNADHDARGHRGETSRRDTARNNGYREQGHTDNHAASSAIGAAGAVFARAADTVAETVGGAFASRKKIDINHSIYADRKQGGFPKSRTQQSFGAMNSRQNIMSSQSYGIDSAKPVVKKIPLLIAVVVILVLLIIAANSLFSKPASSSGSASGTASSSSSVAISGLTDPGSAGTVEKETTVVPIAPTAAVFTYEVADGEDCYLEIYLDGSSTPTVAGTYSGPKRGTYDVTGTLSFVTSRPGAVTLKVDGKAVELQDDNNDGVYVYNMDFSETLAAWKEANGQTTGDSDSASSAS